MTTPRLQEKFKTVVCPKLTEQFGIKNPMALPTLEKIVLNVGLGRQLEGTKVNATAKEQVLADLATITGQKAVMVKAKKSVSNFKVRIGYEIGAMVTLRGVKMWEFFDRLLSVDIPRVKDFRGLKDNSFDGRGNYSFGITEQGIFPEIDMANAKFLHGMNITFVFKNSTNQVTKEALTAIGMPFVKRDQA